MAFGALEALAMHLQLIALCTAAAAALPLASHKRRFGLLCRLRAQLTNPLCLLPAPAGMLLCWYRKHQFKTAAVPRGHRLQVYLGGCTLWSLNLQSLAWVAHSLSMRGTMRPGYEHEGIFFTEHAMCVSGDSVYVFGGQIGGVDTDVLAAIDLNTFSMEVLHRSSLLCR